MTKRAFLLTAVALCALTVIVYWQTFHNDFIDYDDAQYITANRYIQGGLSWTSAKWSLTARIVANWHPLTWMSHMLDYELFGLNPAGHHAVNLLLHVASMLILMGFLARVTRSLWKSAFVAALFGIHPMHVESVAWAAERKDVLSTLFMFLALWAYAVYAERPMLRRYLLVILLFALALMSKPIVVSFPLVLLLLDLWPLNRLAEPHTGRFLPWMRLVYEKIPLFIMSVGGCVATYWAQKGGNAMAYADRYPVDVRVSNAVVSYVTYIAKMIWPQDMAIFYPHPVNTIPEWQVAGSALLLAGVTILSIVLRRRAPYLLVGWLWYICTLVPMIGLVQVGTAAMGDRYTYIPYTGLFVIIAWGVPALVIRLIPSAFHGRALAGLSAAAVVVVLAFSTTTHLQLRHWENGLTVFEHALRVTTDNEVAHVRVGTYALGAGRTDDAVKHFHEAVRINPENYRAHNLLGKAFVQLGRTSDAVREYKTALSIREDPIVHTSLATQLAKQGRLEEAVSHCSVAVRMQPDHAEAYYCMGNILARQERLDEAGWAYTQAATISPGYADAHFNRGVVLDMSGDTREAMKAYRLAIKVKPGHAEAHANLAIDLFISGDYAVAWKEVKLARKHGLEPNPDFVKALAGKMPEPP